MAIRFGQFAPRTGCELLVFLNTGLLDFLSRLCGGEREHLDSHQAHDFLSRLCGGEQSSIEMSLSSDFLSRLCGGEHAVRTFR